MNKRFELGRGAPLLCLILLVLFFAAQTGRPTQALIFLAFLPLQYLIGGRVLHSFLRSDNPLRKTFPLRILLSLSLGIGASLFVWGVSFLLVGRSFPGTLVLLTLAVWGLVTHPKSASDDLLLLPDEFLATCAAALGLGVYHWGLIGIPLGGMIIFPGGSSGDIQFHSGLAALIQSNGLPLVELSGLGVDKFFAPTHLGVPVLLSGMADALAIAPLEASRILAPLGYLILALSVYCLLDDPRIGGRWRFLFAVSSLAIGSLTFVADLVSFNVNGVAAPVIRATFSPGTASGSIYHNITQLFALGLAATALAVIHKTGWRFLGIALSLIVVSGLIKPSLIIILMPALLLSWIVTSRSIVKLLQLLVTIVAWILIYYSPALFFDSASTAGNAFQFSLAKFGEPKSLIGLLLLGGAAWVGWTLSLRRMWKGEATSLEWIAGLSLWGAALFLLCFREVGREGHLNESWAFAGLVALLVPFYTSRNWGGTGAKKSVAFLALSFFCLQVCAGSLYAVAYTHGRAFRDGYYAIKRDDVKIAEELKNGTPQNARILIDPELSVSSWRVSYSIGRQMIPPLDIGGSSPAIDPVGLIEALNGEGDNRLILSRDVVVLKRNRPISTRLEHEGWRKLDRPLPNNAEIWSSPRTLWMND